jgi:anion-transporting  ArsA/GET3 family ATPase
MTEKKVIEMSKKQRSISDKQISQTDEMMRDSLVFQNQSPSSKIRSLNDLNRIKGISHKNSRLNSSITGRNQHFIRSKLIERQKQRSESIIIYS